MARLRFRRVAVSTVVRGGASGCVVACALFGCGVPECYRVALGWPRERSVLHVLLVCAQGRRARFRGFWVVDVCIRLNRCRVRVFDVILMGLRLAPACGAAEAFPASSPKKKKRGCRRLVIIRGRDGATTVSRERFRTHRKS